eukprot:TRINITY_DN9131_c1_g1_i1.p1 TRINITY_DN9131_c1_g1~~TRINITY_DN9131_c1_g1_i1.p1  ORF type:complete len:618 (+),score=306.52 TRINITY_DN9131_c1_g1_i1:56-1855(+)
MADSPRFAEIRGLPTAESPAAPMGWKVVVGTAAGDLIEDLVEHLAGADGTPPLEAMADWVEMRRGRDDDGPAVNGCAKALLAQCPPMLDACNGLIGHLCSRVGAAAVSLRQTLQWGPSGQPNPFQLIRDWARSADGCAGSPVRAARASRSARAARQKPAEKPRRSVGRGSAAQRPRPQPKKPAAAAGPRRPSAGGGGSPAKEQAKAPQPPPPPPPIASPPAAAAEEPDDDTFAATTAESDTMREIREQLAALSLHQAPEPELPPQPEQPPAPDAAPEVQGLLREMESLREQVRRLAEKGSPTDDDLAQMDARAHEYDGLKYQVADVLSAAPGRVTIAEPQEAVDALVKVLAEGDEREGAPEVVAALLHHVAAPFAETVDSQGLVALQCGDGNVQFLELLLGALPHTCFDAAEVLASACFSQTRRIPLVAKVLASVDLLPFADECAPLLQEYFEDVASHARAIPKEERGGRPELLRTLLSLPEALRPTACGDPGPDGLTVFARCVSDGDLVLLDLLRTHAPKSLTPTDELPDGTTPLQHCVLRGRLDVLRELLSMDGCEVDKETGRGGTALGLAEVLRKDDVAAELRRRGAVRSVPPKPD